MEHKHVLKFIIILHVFGCILKGPFNKWLIVVLTCASRRGYKHIKIICNLAISNLSES